MSRFSQALKDNDFLVTVELEPPKGADLGLLQELAQEMSGRVDAVVLADNPRAEARMDPVMAAHKLLRHSGVEVILTLTCRDRNRLALTSQMLGAAAAGVDSLLIVSGDFVNLGDHPGAKPVYDLDSVQTLQLARQISQGQDMAGNDLTDPPSFILGAAISPQAEPFGAQLLKLRKKLQAGANFIMTMPLGDTEDYAKIKAEAGEAKLIAGVAADDPASRDTAVADIKSLKGSGADGVHLSIPTAQEELPTLLNACGL
jgi:methylenetetrahydrofolate reductase (NADPH)